MKDHPIIIKGARQNNLKNIYVIIPRTKHQTSKNKDQKIQKLSK